MSNTLPQYIRRLPVSRIADDLIRDNYFSTKQVSQIRDAEYHSTTSEEFWRLVEEKKII